MTAFVAEHPDYESVAMNPELPITPAMAEVIADAENPPALAYYLGQNIEEADAISRMSPTAMARAIGRIEARLETKPEPKPKPDLPKKTTNAPPPPKTVSGAGAPPPSVDDPNITTEQRIALWKKAKGPR